MDTQVISQFMSFYSIISVFTSVVGIIFFLLTGFGLYEMGKKLNLKNAYISFIPLVSYFAFGRVAEKYQKKDGSKSAKFSVLLLVLTILQYIILAVFIVLLVFAIVDIYNYSEIAITQDTSLELSMFSAFIPVIICYFVLMALCIALSVLYYVAFWRICAIFDKSNATVFTVLAIFFSFLIPIFLFVLRKNKPNVIDVYNIEEQI